MSDPLALIRHQTKSVADAIRWACLLEATAPKVGNVHPGQSFDDLTFANFVEAANIAADMLSAKEHPIAQRMLRTIQETRRITGTNVNLGIVLLLGPLVAAETPLVAAETPLVAAETALVAAETLRKEAIANVLDSFTIEDGRFIYEAIRIAGAGGLGTTESMDVTATSAEPIDLIAAMKSAAGRDRIALQYAGGFDDLIENVVPVVSSAIHDCGDILIGIADAHLTLLSQSPDSLIARKCGFQVANEVQSQARKTDRNNAESIHELNQFLRSRGNSLNPGTTADLIAAALYILLRTPCTRE